MPAFKGKVFKLERLHKCPICGNEPVIRRDSTKRFQVWCYCGCKTGWKTKPEAIIDWYNLILAVKNDSTKLVEEIHDRLKRQEEKIMPIEYYEERLDDFLFRGKPIDALVMHQILTNKDLASLKQKIPEKTLQRIQERL